MNVSLNNCPRVSSAGPAMSREWMGNLYVCSYDRATALPPKSKEDLGFLKAVTWRRGGEKVEDGAAPQSHACATLRIKC
ncbi:hypothetical protein Y032_0611g634 [Ancylostoma ceylanicum]|uniref:Uncharacterized protein n=1 Tax=Ancylostoma ceylanicum TaxID=53326 RepID=A0A016WN54_9BILA|nr:hypothetical protein Y032_0611g634 [Ancylostoma ceylanicum]